MTKNEILEQSGIYSITNKINRKRYIGCTKSFKNRFKEHKNKLLKNKHFNNHLQSAWNKYGSSNFEFDVIELCSEDELFIREHHWVNILYTYQREFGYNIRGTSPDEKFKMSEETKSKLKGLKRSSEHFYVMSALKKEYFSNLENKRKMSEGHKAKQISVGEKNPNYGKKASDDKKAKSIASQIKSGTIYPFYRISPDLKVEGPFLNIKQYCRENNLISKGVFGCIAAKFNTYKGFNYCKEVDLETRLNSIKQNSKFWKYVNTKSNESKNCKAA